MIGIPLLGIPPILVALLARCGNENVTHLLDMHNTVIHLLDSHGIHPTSLSSDGTETERALQRSIAANSPSYYSHTIISSVPNCTITSQVPLINGFPSVIVQDSKHAAKTGRNQLLSGARFLAIGSFPMFYHMLLDLANHPLSCLFRRDVERVDKQDDRAAARLFSGETLHCLSTHFPGHRALIVYIFVIGELIDAWQNRRIQHITRVQMVLRARFFLMAWRTHIIKHPDHRTDIHFISRESFNIFLCLCDSLIQLVISYRQFFPMYPLLPWLHSTEMVEHLFGILRKLKADFNFADVLYAEPKLRTLMLGAFQDRTADEQANLAAGGYYHTYFSAPDFDEHALRLFPTDVQLEVASQHALTDVSILLDTVGISALDMLSEYTPPDIDQHTSTWQPDPTELSNMTLADIMSRFQHISTSSTAQEDKIGSVHLALIAESTDRTQHMYVLLQHVMM